MTRESHYVHGSAPAEQERLRLLNALLNRRHLDSLGLHGGERVLELGAGTGVFALELARAVGPRGAVVAVERDELPPRVRCWLHHDGARVDLAGRCRRASARREGGRASTWARASFWSVRDPQAVVNALVAQCGLAGASC